MTIGISKSTVRHEVRLHLKLPSSLTVFPL